jgi:2-iminobutanoate/2-iminopropanoate deaminase
MQQVIASSPELAPAGHYASAIVHGGLVYLSGTLPADSPGSEIQPFEQQMQSLIRNCDVILDAAGSNAACVLSLTLYLTDLGNWQLADAMLAHYFGRHRPARSVIAVPAIRKSFAVQASLIATVRSNA